MVELNLMKQELYLNTPQIIWPDGQMKFVQTKKLLMKCHTVVVK